MSYKTGQAPKIGDRVFHEAFGREEVGTVILQPYPWGGVTVKWDGETESTATGYSPHLLSLRSRKEGEDIVYDEPVLDWQDLRDAYIELRRALTIMLELAGDYKLAHLGEVKHAREILDSLPPKP